MIGSNYCYAHRNMTPEGIRDRWLNKYIIGVNRYPLYTIISPFNKSKILKDLHSKTIVLTREDILKIPAKEAYVDIYMLLLENKFAQYGDHPRLEFIGLWLYTSLLYNFPFVAYPVHHQTSLRELRLQLEKHLILSSGRSLYKFLNFMGGTAMGRRKVAEELLWLIPRLLDTEAAKEMSWMSYDELDKIRLTYEKHLGKNHALTKCLVQRWLLDIKELYQTEKAIQKIKMDQCKEELMMNRWHPSRLQKYLNMGYEIDQLDDVM